MKDLQKKVREYIALRQSLGYKLRKFEARLNEFVTFLDGKGASHVTSKLVLAWVVESAHGAMTSRSERLYIVRGFARYLSAMDARNEVPPVRLVPRPHVSLRPYIYTNEEILRLMEAAQNLFSPRKLRCHTYNCLVGLLAVTGLRSGEAMRLRKEDVDLSQATVDDTRDQVRQVPRGSRPCHDRQSPLRLRGPQGCVPGQSQRSHLLYKRTT